MTKWQSTSALSHGPLGQFCLSLEIQQRGSEKCNYKTSSCCSCPTCFADSSRTQNGSSALVIPPVHTSKNKVLLLLLLVVVVVVVGGGGGSSTSTTTTTTTTSSSSSSTVIRRYTSSLFRNFRLYKMHILKVFF